jgi:avidin family protein
MTIAGDWYNELGSHMRLTLVSSDGIAGTYESATGNAAGPYVLAGRYDKPAREDRGIALGWTVAWHNERHDADSVTSWNGLYQDDGSGAGERICATWLLTTAATAAEAWDATTVGQDVFTRQPPAPDQAIEHRRRRRPGEPMLPA